MQISCLWCKYLLLFVTWVSELHPSGVTIIAGTYICISLPNFYIFFLLANLQLVSALTWLLLRIRGTWCGFTPNLSKKQCFPFLLSKIHCGPAVLVVTGNRHRRHWFRKLNPSQHFDRSSQCHSKAVSKMSWGSNTNTITITANYTISCHTVVPVMLNTWEPPSAAQLPHNTAGFRRST